MSLPSPEDLRPVFTAADYLAHQKNVASLACPRSLILTYQNILPQYAAHHYRVYKTRQFGADLLLLKKFNRQIGILSGFGAGAPATAVIADLFCALGVERFLILGMAGGLQADLSTGDLILCAEAIRAEGTSPHYLPEADTVASSESLLTSLSAALTARNHAHRIGSTWTTDAPFRELRGEVLAHQRRGILAVDMEAAALLAVAQANSRSAAAAFAIVDSLADGAWKMPQDVNPARAGLVALFESALEAL